MRHEWTEDGRSFAVHSVGEDVQVLGHGAPSFAGGWGLPLSREILRLAERVRELEARAAIDLQTMAGVLENRDAVRAIKEQLSRDVASLEEHIRQARQYLRIECGELGDNDWSDDLHLADVIEKHLARPVGVRIATLEEENRRLRAKWEDDPTAFDR